MADSLLSAASSSTASSLVRGVRESDPDAWARLTEAYGPLIYGWVRGLGVADQDAGDVVQDVFREVVRSVAGFDPERGTRFRAWLWGVTRHKVLQAVRAAGGRPVAVGGTDAYDRLLAVAEPDPPSVSDDAPDGPQEPAGWAAVRDEFEARTWTAFWQMAVEKRSAADVAAHLGMTEKAVRQAKYRVARRLREVLGSGTAP